MNKDSKVETVQKPKRIPQEVQSPKEDLYEGYAGHIPKRNL